MIYKYFSIQFFLRIVFVFINMMVISIFIIHTERLFTSITLILILIIQVVNLYRFLTKTNIEVEQFVDSLKYEEAGTRFISTTKTNKLYDAFNEILEYIENIKIEKEAQFHFLNIILKNADVGIITHSENNKVEIMNIAAQNILDSKKLKTWDEIKKSFPEFAKEVLKVKSGHHNLIEFTNKEEKFKLSVSVTNIKILEKAFTIIVFQNIRSEIEQSELDSWNKLIRTMAHEIMNSLTPISSLTETSLLMLQDEKGNLKKEEEFNTKKLDKLRRAITTIEKRSNSLIHFVEDFRNLARLPKPEPTDINMVDFINHIEKLYEASFKNDNIVFEKEIDEDPFLIYADEKLLEQVFVNILKNSIEALSNISPATITIKCYYDNKFKIIDINDNGTGIPKEEIEKIFIPFYSTKEKGSGIGLSLSRQIMQLHKGKIDIISKENLGTTIRLSFL
jgi:nitrogen fixation/metabolism regulation signal transduction histidine kinase